MYSWSAYWNFPGTRDVRTWIFFSFDISSSLAYQLIYKSLVLYMHILWSYSFVYLNIYYPRPFFYSQRNIFKLHYLKLILVENKWREFKKSFCFILFHKMICETKVNAKTFLQWKWFLKWWSFINEFRCLQFEKNLMAVW